MAIDLKNKIEAVLFLEADPVEVSDLAKKLEVEEEKCLEEILSLKKDYRKIESSLSLVLNEKQAQLVIKKDLSQFVEKFFNKKEKKENLSPAMLEVLSIILYKGPIGKAGIEKIRGVNCGLILRKLSVKGYIDREEQVESSRIFIYKPSLNLLKKLGISRLEELPDHDKLSSELN